MLSYKYTLDEGDDSQLTPVAAPYTPSVPQRELGGGIDATDVCFARRSAAILAMDVVGYSALIELDDLGTASRLRTMRHCVLEPTIALHSGLVFSVAGDGVMASFASAPDAVACALAIRTQCRDGEEVDAPGTFPLRTGISYGDVLGVGDELYGSPLNIAARLEARADPGGILISGSVFDRSQGLCGANYTSLGEWRLKKLRNPCRVYRVKRFNAPQTMGDRHGQARHEPRRGRVRRCRGEWPLHLQPRPDRRAYRRAGISATI